MMKFGSQAWPILILLAQGRVLAEAQVTAGKEEPSPGKEVTLFVSGIKEAARKDGTPQNVPFVVYLPANYVKGHPLPVLMEWHGAGGQAGVGVVRSVSGGKDFICVGLTYINGKPETEDLYVKAAYEKALQLGGDAKAVFCGGFSFGGLAMEKFLLRPANASRYRGVWMFGAGLLGNEKDFRPGQLAWLKEVPFFVAVGETDFNRKAVEQQAPLFKKELKEYQVQVMPGIGHAVDLEHFGAPLLAFFRKHLPKGESQVETPNAQPDSSPPKRPASRPLPGGQEMDP